MHVLEFDKETITFLSKVDKAIRDRIFNKIISSKQDPFHYFKRLKGRDDYKMRVGSYRIIADISKNKIKITLIGHRKRIYDKR